MKTSKLTTLNVLIGNLDGSEYTDAGENPAVCAVKYVDGTVTSSVYDKLTLEYESGKSIDLALFRVEYDKKIYAPGKVELCFNLNGNIDEKTLPGILRTKFKSVTINLYGADDKHVAVPLAKNYYIHSISQKRASVETISSDGKSVLVNSQKQLTMLCYSPDNRMTINKYCNTYVKKKFYEEILNKEITSVFSGKGITLNKQEFCHIEATKKDNKIEELIQPYLVQYNESFYDFIVRVASRCGEYLYYEGEKLNFGLPKETKSLSNQKSFEGITLSDYSDIYIDFESEGINRNDIGSYAFDYTQKKGNNTSGTYRVDTMVGADDYLRRTVEGDGPELNEILDTWEIVSCFGAGFTGEQIEESLTNMVNDAGTNVAQSLIAHAIAKDDFKRGYVNDNNKNSFGTLDLTDPTKNLNNAFYHKIQKGVSAVTEGMLNVDTENHLQNFTLGCGISTGDTLHEKGYIVTRMHGIVENKIKVAKGENGDFYVNYTVRRNWVEATPIYYEKKDSKDEIIDFFPPECGISPIRKAEPQVGIVTAADDPLRLGRVRVDFAWQKDNMDAEANEGKISDANSSPWIRVAVPYSGGSTDGGMNVTLEKGENVMLNFIGGNIECPYVEGALFTKNNKPNLGWVELKSKYFVPKYTPRVIASSSGHSISFIDGKNSSAFTAGICPPIGQVWSLVKGARGVVEKYSKNANKWDFQGDRPDLYGGIVLRDSLGIYEIEASTHKRSISINSPIGKVDINAFTGITISAPNGDVKIKGKNVSIEAGNNVTITSGKNIRGEKYTADTAYAALGSTLGGILANVITGTSKDLLGFDPTKLTDMSFIRSCWEVIMRPVEGSLKIQSKRNVLMTAGKGKVNVPSSLLSHAVIQRKGKEGKKKLSEWVPDEEEFYNDVLGYFKDIKQKVDSTFDIYRQQIYSIRSKYRELKNLNPTGNFYQEGIVKDGKFIFLDKFIKGGDLPNLTKDRFIKLHMMVGWLAQGGRKDLFDISDNAFRLYSEIKKEYENSYIGAISAGIKGKVTSAIKDEWTNVVNGITPVLCEDATLKAKAFQEKFASGHYVQSIKNQVLRSIYYDILSSQSATTSLYLDVVKDEGGNKLTKDQIIFADNSWQYMVNAITDKDPNKLPKVPDGFAKSLGKGFGSEVSALSAGFYSYDLDKGGKWFGSIQQLINFNGVSGPRSVWDAGHGGSILLSNSSGTTYNLSAKGNHWEPQPNCIYQSVIEFLKNISTEAEH